MPSTVPSQLPMRRDSLGPAAVDKDALYVIRCATPGAGDVPESAHHPQAFAKGGRRFYDAQTIRKRIIQT